MQIGDIVSGWFSSLNPVPVVQDKLPAAVDKKVGGVASFALGVLALLFKSPVIGFSLLAVTVVIIYYERKNIAKVAVVSSILGLAYKGASLAEAVMKKKNNSSTTHDSSTTIDPNARVVFTTPEEHAREEAAKKSKNLTPPKSPRVLQGHPSPSSSGSTHNTPIAPPKSPSRQPIVKPKEKVHTSKPVTKQKKTNKPPKSPHAVKPQKPKDPEKKKTKG